MTNIIGLIFVIIVGLAIYMSYEAKYKNINLNQLNTKLYIQAADDASKGKLQVNWKYMAAIDGVRYKNDFSNISDQSLNELANMFLEKNSTSSKIKNSEYELVDLDVVLGKLSLDEKQKRKYIII
ncbi:hypothetical protein B0H42_004601 [Clostridium saccharobutylicum]|nr:hypothetical protein [Clostridium saccharobutylicum]